MKPQKTQTPDTRVALLECAKTLFLTYGFKGVSIRQITKAAGSNVAAINYHFSGKTNLFREVLAQCLDEITQDKLAILEELDKQQPAADLKQILNVYIRSFFDSFSSPESDRLTQIIYQEMGLDAVASDLVATHLIVPINQAVQKRILKICPDLDKNHVSYCVSSITGQVIHFIRARDILKGIHNLDQNQTFIENIVQHITQFSLRGIGSNHHA
jgi:AcrR family transcriptional regulator